MVWFLDLQTHMSALKRLRQIERIPDKYQLKSYLYEKTIFLCLRIGCDGDIRGL